MNKGSCVLENPVNEWYNLYIYHGEVYIRSWQLDP